jgi:hypothetical protein
MERTLFLFDIDGVLVHPVGYKVALRATLDYFARQMGLPDINLTWDEISVFEACGITNEWDSSLMCVSAMLVDILEAHPELLRLNLRDTFEAIRDADVRFKRPDLASLARKVQSETPNGSPPTGAIRKVIRQRAPGYIQPLLDVTLGDIYSIDTPTTCIFQHFSLGSKRFSKTYGLPAVLETESALLVHDVPLISQDMLSKLLAINNPKRPGMAIFTARPSLPPTRSTTKGTKRNFPPEANLAAELLGLDKKVPLVAGGHMIWLAERNGKDPADYIKPAPVQALAAIGAACSGEIVASLEAAARFTGKRKPSGPLKYLLGDISRIVVFEDSVGGIQSVRYAVDLLARSGAMVYCEAIGIAPEDTKQESLATVADYVFSDVNQGLALYLSG